LADAEAGRVGPGERIVVLVTGNGLKDVASAGRAVAKAPRIEPRLDDLLRAIDQRQRST
jgi:threonine synthase